MTRQEVVFEIKAIYDGDRTSDTVQHYTPDADEEINVMAVNLPIDSEPILAELKSEGAFEDFESGPDETYNFYSVNKAFWEEA